MIKILPLTSPKTGLVTTPLAYFSNSGVEYQQEAFYNYGVALAVRLRSRINTSQRFTIATTIHDLDNLTKGVMDTLDLQNSALNIMYVDPDIPFITQTRYEDKGKRDILIVPIHIVNECFTVMNIIKEAKKHATFTEMYILTPVVEDGSYTRLLKIMPMYSEKMDVISLHLDNTHRYRRFLESSPVYDDSRTIASKFLIDSFRRTRP